MKGRKKKEKTENKKWLFLGGAILLATVLIAIVIKLPFAPGGSIDGDGLNATLINDKDTVQLTPKSISNNYNVTESKPLTLNVKPEGKTTWYSENMITKYKANGQFVYCIELGRQVQLAKDPNRTTALESSSNYWKSLSAEKQKNIGLILTYGFPNNNFLSGTEDQKYVATQILIWEIQQEWRDNFTDKEPKNMKGYTKEIVYDKWVKNDTAVKKVYEDIINAISKHSEAPKATSVELNKVGTEYIGTVSGDYTGFTCNDSVITCEFNEEEKKLIIRSSSPISSTQKLTLTKNLPSNNDQGMLILEHAKNQRMIIGKPSLKVETTVNVTTKATGTIIIEKKTEDNSTKEFEFQITGPNDYQKTVKVQGGKSVTVYDLEIGALVSTYSIKEINTPSEYIEPGIQLCPLTSVNHECTVEFENNLKNNSSVRVSKVDENGSLIAGAELVLKDSNNKEVEKWTSTTSSYVIKAKLDVGKKYKICETKAPSGYIKTDECKEVIINSKTDSPTIVFENKKEPNKVSIAKKDSKTGELIGGARLQLLDHKGTIIHEWVSEKGKVETIDKNIILGAKYTIVEIAPPDGYFIAEPKEFEFTKNEMTVEINDEPLYVEISKQDIATSKEIAGAHLQIKDSKGEVVDEWVSEEGKIHIFKNKKTGENLVYGETYTLIETIAPDGYSISEQIKFEVGKDRKVTMNNEVTKVIVKKLDTVTKKRVIGAHLQILDEKGSVVKEHDTTNTDWVVTGLLTGKQYTVVETKVPDKYLVAEKQTFKLKATENSMELTLYDTPIVDVPNTAVDINIITIIAGALFATSGVAIIIWIKKRSA